jgi:hypothetical protein
LGSDGGGGGGGGEFLFIAGEVISKLGDLRPRFGDVLPWGVPEDAVYIL